ncbi:unnamed protein product [Musa banksii]
MKAGVRFPDLPIFDEVGGRAFGPSCLDVRWRLDFPTSPPWAKMGLYDDGTRWAITYRPQVKEGSILYLHVSGILSLVSPAIEGLLSCRWSAEKEKGDSMLVAEAKARGVMLVM